MTSYETDLAFIHDRGFGDHSRNAAPFILQTLRKRGIKKGLVVDLGCGSGIWAEQLCLAGYEVFGMDLSASMLRIARERVPSARFQRCSYLDASLPTCVAVTALGEVLNYRFDGRIHRASIRRLFRRIHTALIPGGLLVFDIAGPGRGRGYEKRYWEGDDWVVLQEAKEDAGKNELTRRITTFRKVGKSYRRSEEVHVLKLYRPREIASELSKLGFRVLVRRGYGTQKLLPGMAALFARKP